MAEKVAVDIVAAVAVVTVAAAVAVVIVAAAVAVDTVAVAADTATDTRSRGHEQHVPSVCVSGGGFFYARAAQRR